VAPLTITAVSALWSVGTLLIAVAAFVFYAETERPAHDLLLILTLVWIAFAAILTGVALL
jgi:tryptophan-rich sensory protein